MPPYGNQTDSSAYTG